MAQPHQRLNGIFSLHKAKNSLCDFGERRRKAAVKFRYLSSTWMHDENQQFSIGIRTVIESGPNLLLVGDLNSPEVN